MLDEIESKTVHKVEVSNQQRKKSKTLSVLKLVENTSKNSYNFLEINALQKEVLPSHKLQNHAYE